MSSEPPDVVVVTDSNDDTEDEEQSSNRLQPLLKRPILTLLCETPLLLCLRH
jgi:hypothetical protein